jgi:hypothetical protein
MPGGNKQGPLGQGPLSGRGAGYCGGRGRPGFATAGNRGVGGRGQGPGGEWGRRGWRRGHRNQFWATGLTGWQREAVTTQATDQPMATQDDSPEDMPPAPPGELTTLRELVDRLAQSVQNLENRLQPSEGTCD